MERSIASAKEAVDHLSTSCSRVAQATLSRGPASKLAPLLKESKAALDAAQVWIL